VTDTKLILLFSSVNNQIILKKTISHDHGGHKNIKQNYFQP